ncbi:unnamed protein product [Pedinophyceae sp. YPF-701]|nr:unnamed protein product [Pedinophyceae sp. YPF-701]
MSSNPPRQGGATNEAVSSLEEQMQKAKLNGLNVFATEFVPGQPAPSPPAPPQPQANGHAKDAQQNGEISDEVMAQMNRAAQAEYYGDFEEEEDPYGGVYYSEMPQLPEDQAVVYLMQACPNFSRASVLEVLRMCSGDMYAAWEFLGGMDMEGGQGP